MPYSRNGRPRFPPKLKELKRSSALALNLMDTGLGRDGGMAAKAMAETAPKSKRTPYLQETAQKSALNMDKAHGKHPAKEAAVNEQIAAIKFSGVVWRNNRGALHLGNGRYMRYGVGGNGASDWIGYRTVTVTPAMVGSRVAIFTAIEAKRHDGTVRPDQNAFIEQIREAGGIAGIARSGKDALAIINQAANDA